MEIMPIEYLDDWETRLQRQDAFWHGEVIGRPVTHIQIARGNSAFPRPEPRQYQNHRDRWRDFEFRAQRELHKVMNSEYLGDALPRIHPNLGPEIFSAFFGTEMEYGESTTWAVPNLKDWKDVDALQFSEDNPHWQDLVAYTDLLLENGKGRYYTGMTDLHPGGDAIAAFRDPQELNLDMIEHPDEVKALLERVTQVFCQIYDYWADKLLGAGQAITTWTGIVSSKRWYIPGNDFSCMISEEMFRDIFLPGIREECQHLEASIYHLDGPNALRHLDAILEIPELNAIQWVYGAGQGRATDWMDVYKRCQAAGKGIQIGIAPDEVDTFMAELKPEGIWMGVGPVQDRDEADAILKKVATWT
jgi:hypothetical protein